MKNRLELFNYESLNYEPFNPLGINKVKKYS